MASNNTNPTFECSRDDCDGSFHSQIALDLHTLRHHDLRVDVDADSR